MLRLNQMSDLDGTLEDLKNKKLILDIAIDTQAILRMMVDKGMTTREEVQKYREEVRGGQKYLASYQYLDQALKEVMEYKNDPQKLLRAAFQEKMKGK
ncbi:MAG TPA: hypothetical protein H9761_17070 [Candidatus Eisenbergiella merdavium]|uniref:Uncharacterized protein n=1 Tax=Candidatus Eisenbergiella merdavium TaxID=2838551 RepID=A0A9D2SSC3_9FIRM|nr:hypothetical protein [Candidatus Eisenbergiella merdavium]